jgi:hypothetical protein
LTTAERSFCTSVKDMSSINRERICFLRSCKVPSTSWLQICWPQKTSKPSARVRKTSAEPSS